MPKNPFSRKAGSIQPHVARSRAPSICNDEVSLRARVEQRTQFDFADVPLFVRSQTTTNRYYERSFTKLVDHYPHHELLIKQLLRGAQLDLGTRLVSYQTHQDAYYAIEEFIDFLNKSNSVKHKEIFVISDLDFQATRNFSAYYLENHPSRTVNRKRFGRLRTIINKLKKKYEANPIVGGVIVWAQSPSTTDSPSESYSTEVFNQLVESSLGDVKFIMKMMKEYPQNLRSAREFLASKQNFSLRSKSTRAWLDEGNDLIFALVANAKPIWPLYESFNDAAHCWSSEWSRELKKAKSC